MALTTLQKTQLNNMNASAQRASLGTLVGGMEDGSAGLLRKITQTVLFSEFTDGGGASGTFVLTAGSIPAGATVLYSAVTAITGFTGDTSAVIVIGDGTDADRYNTGTPSVFTTAANGIAVGAPSGVVYHAAAKSVTLTVTSATDFGSVAAGSVTVSLYYLV